MQIPTLTRREFLRLAGLSLAPLSLPGWTPRLAFAPPGAQPSGDVLVCVFLRGGMDGLHAVIPSGDPAYFAARPTLAIPEPSPGDDDAAIPLDDRFALHPALRPLLEAYQSGHLAIVHGCGSPDPTHSHFEAMDYMERGTPGEKQIPTGWIARHLMTASWENASPFRAVGMGGVLQASLRGPVPATALRSITQFHLGGDPGAVSAIQGALSSLYAQPVEDESILSDLNGQAATTFEAIDILARFDPGAYRPVGGAEYPAGEFGKALSEVAMLAKAEVGLEVACLDLGGWDTHVQQGTQEGVMPRLMAELSAGLAALHRDMGEQMNGVSLVTMSEFGRRVEENGGGGTDHGHGNVMFVMGGGIHGGRVYGDWLGLERERLYGPGDLFVTTDFRDVLGEIVSKRLRNNRLADIFPGYENFRFAGLAEERRA
jgi:uncharacterized protein (DUF1501 family)